MRRETVDYFGETMAIRRDMGEPYLAWFGQVNTRSGEIRWHRMDHVAHDGTGALAHILRSLGHAIERLPGHHPPEPERRLRAWWDGYRHMSFRRVAWRRPLRRDAPQRGPLELDTPPAEPLPLCYHVFSLADSRAIERRALQAGGAVYAHLLAELNAVVGPALTEPGSRYHWMVPVNLRGGLELPDPLANHVSVLSVVTDHATGAREIQAQIRDHTRRGHAWAFYWTLRALRRALGRTGFRWVQAFVGKTDFLIGCLTDIGAWRDTRPGQAPDPDEGWIITPTVNRNNPVAAGTISWNGRISIALAVHPALEVSGAELGEWFEKWRRRLLGEEQARAAA